MSLHRLRGDRARDLARAGRASSSGFRALTPPLVRFAAPAPRRRREWPSRSTTPPLLLGASAAERTKDGVRGATPTGADQSITETLHLALPLDTVWTALQDPALIAQCVPGARLSIHDPRPPDRRVDRRARPDSRPFRRDGPRHLPRGPHRHRRRRGPGPREQNPSSRQRGVHPDRIFPGHLRPHADHHLCVARPVGTIWPRPGCPRSCRRTGRERRAGAGGPAARYGAPFPTPPAPAAIAVARAATLVIGPTGANLRIASAAELTGACGIVTSSSRRSLINATAGLTLMRGQQTYRGNIDLEPLRYLKKTRSRADRSTAC